MLVASDKTSNFYEVPKAEYNKLLLNEITKTYKRSEVDQANTGGETPLWIASTRGHNSVVQVLLDYDAVVGKADTNHGNTPLYQAVVWNHAPVVNTLIAAIAAGREVGVIDKADTDGRTPLHRAVEKGYTDIVGKLLVAGADINKGDNWGITPLHEAVSMKKDVIVRQLLEAGADMDQQNKWGGTPLLNAHPIHDQIYQAHNDLCSD